MMNIQEIEDKHLAGLYPKRDVALTRGKGLVAIDEQGEEYIDCMMGYGTVILGHSHNEFTVALSLQLNNIIGVHSSFYSDARANLLETLHSILPEELTRTYLCNSGTEAIEAALKFARLSTNKPGVISTKRAYHGRTMGALSVNGTPKYRKPFEPLLEPNAQVIFNDIEDLKNAYTEEMGAVILEPIQGEGGVVPATKEYLQSVRNFCNETGMVLIFDEVQTGFRTGDWLASTVYDVVPDILCLAKALGNGFPIGATVIQEQYAEHIPKGSHGTTFGSNPLACVAANATLLHIKENNLHDNALAMGSYLYDGLSAIDSSIIREVRGVGLMLAIELKKKSGLYAQRLQREQHLIAMPTGTVLRLLPPLTITQDEADEIIRRVEVVLTS